MNKRMLKHRLIGGGGTHRGTAGGGDGRGVGIMGMDISAKMEVVGAGLDRRASLEELTNQGIFQVARARVFCVAWRTHVQFFWWGCDTAVIQAWS